MHTSIITRKNLAFRKLAFTVGGESRLGRLPKSPVHEAGTVLLAMPQNVGAPGPVVINALCRVACGLAKHLPPQQAQTLVSMRLAAYNLGGRLAVTEAGRQQLKGRSTASPSMR